MVHDYCEYAEKVFAPSKGVQAVVSNAGWKRPPSGWVKVNVDVHVCNSGAGGLGAVIRDESGRGCCCSIV